MYQISPNEGSSQINEKILNKEKKDTRVAQSVKCLTLGFGSGHDSRVVRSSPEAGSTLSSESA